jgi:O-antigen/teichoic acid export membrane protein
VTTTLFSMSVPVTTVSQSQSLGGRTARGFAWMVSQTVASRIVSAAGQVAMAWFLLPDDYGAVGLAFTIAAFASLVQQAGFKEILVQRFNHFSRWANAAFWMSLSYGMLSGLLMVGAALAVPLLPPVAQRYPELPGLLLALAAAAPLTTLSTVPMARLQAELRFGTLATIVFASATATTVLSVLLAWGGLGPQSVVLPRALVALAQAMVLFLVCGFPARATPQWRRWRFLAGDSLLLIATWVCYAIIMQGDYAALALLRPRAELGLYFFAFNLSVQAVTLFTVNLWGVLMPALSQLQDDTPRQLAAFQRASRALALVAVPFGFLQTALADPGVRLLFAPKWHTAIPVLQVLSLGMTFMMIGSQGGSLLQAQGRFKTMFLLSAGCAAAFVVMVGFGALLGGALIVATVVAVYYAAYGPVNLFLGMRPAGGTWRDVWSIYSVSIAPGAVAVGAGWLGVMWVPDGTVGSVLKLALVPLISLAIYLPLVRRVAREDWNELMARFMGFARRRKTLAQVGPSDTVGPLPRAEEAL